LVEDELIGVPAFLQAAKKFKFEPALGLRMSIRSNPTDAFDEHKIVVLAKNAAGCRLINRIFKSSFTGEERFTTYESLKSLWNKRDLSLIIPFYDSFIHANNLKFGTIVPDLSFADVTLFLEDNDLAIDLPIAEAVRDFSKSFSIPIQRAKSIFYKNRADIDAFMAYKIICGKTMGRGRSLQKPELPHFCSAEFCFESFKEAK
jgi:DNA polymerase III alpha subunit